MAEYLPQKPFDPIADHRVTHFTAYSDPKAAQSVRITSVDEDEMRLMDPGPLMGEKKKFDPLP